jgi:hypothetical protein
MRVRDVRFDFRGGTNRSFSPDVLDSTELVRAKNAHTERYGSITKRPGSQRIHDTALGAAILGLHFWRGPEGREVVAIADGNFHHWRDTAEFTTIASSFSTTLRPWFTQHTAFGSPLLYIADGGLWKWDGTNLSAVAGAPDARVATVYKSRMFVSDGSRTVYWSAVADPDEWDSTFGAGQGNAETYDTDGITGLAVTGGSLLLFKNNSIARFTGVSRDDIRIDQQTEGISPDIGCVAPRSIIRLEEVVFFLSDRGPYIASEAGVQAIGVKMEAEFDDANTDAWQNAVAVHHQGRREVWLFIPPSGETQNTRAWVYNYRVGSWKGPYEFGFNVAAAAPYERPDAKESVILGGYDGRVRHGDVPEVGSLDDVLRDGSGGVPVQMEIELPELYFQDPSRFKIASGPHEIGADLGDSGVLRVVTSGDECATQELFIPSRGPGVHQYRFRPGWRGRRLRLVLREDTGSRVEITGLTLNARVGRRQV